MRRLVPLLLILLTAAPLPSLASSCKVPLKLVNIGSAEEPEYKLGINVGIGGGAPRLYEFDTGGAGFWAAYDAEAPTQWWGSVKTVSQGDMAITYTSGTQYQANLVRGRVALFPPDAADARSPLCATGNRDVSLSQITAYTDEKKPEKEREWTDALKNGRAPLFGAFWGDFGAALHPALNDAETAGIYSILPQVASRKLPHRRGFIVHVGKLGGNTQPYVKIGLSRSDVRSFRHLVKMNRDCPARPGSSANYCLPPWIRWSNVPVVAISEQQFSANVTVSSPSADKNQLLSGIGITMDTGAPEATVWQHDDVVVDPDLLKDPSPISGTDPQAYSGRLKNGGSVSISTQRGTTVWGSRPFSAQMYEAPPEKIRADVHKKANEGVSYLNTGIWFFSQWDVMFDLDSGIVGFRRAE